MPQAENRNSTIRTISRRAVLAGAAAAVPAVTLAALPALGMAASAHDPIFAAIEAHRAAEAAFDSAVSELADLEDGLP
jgi:hypothetical protein